MAMASIAMLYSHYQRVPDTFDFLYRPGAGISRQVCISTVVPDLSGQVSEHQNQQAWERSKSRAMMDYDGL